MNPPLAAIILAAGRGTRLQSVRVNKVMRRLRGKPILGYTVETLKKIGLDQIIIVVHFQKEGIIKYFGSSLTYVEQKDTLGTGDAVKQALPAISPSIQTVLIMYGDDSAFYPEKLMTDLITHHRNQKAGLTFLTVKKANPTGLGRILRSQDGKVLGIREEKNCSEEEKKITEINTGCYVINKDLLEKVIPKIKKDPLKKEYYLTDIVELSLEQNAKVEAFFTPKDSIHVGVNTPTQLSYARSRMKKRFPSPKPKSMR